MYFPEEVPGLIETFSHTSSHWLRAVWHQQISLVPKTGLFPYSHHTQIFIDWYQRVALWNHFISLRRKENQNLIKRWRWNATTAFICKFWETVGEMLGPHRCLACLSVLDKMTKLVPAGAELEMNQSRGEGSTQLAALRVGLSPSPCPTDASRRRRARDP